SDWGDHITTAFPEVRLKKFIEMRGADGGPWRRLCALPAFWTGLLYEQSSLDAAWDLVKDWTMPEREALRDQVPKLGLKTPAPGAPRRAAPKPRPNPPAPGGATPRDTAENAQKTPPPALKPRARLDYLGRDESIFLDSVEEIARTGQTQADRMLASYNGEWK